MTNILTLPRVAYQASFGNNEDWIDHVMFMDDAGNPISLAGISFSMELRHLAPDGTVLLTASTADGALAIHPNVSTLMFDLPVARMKLAPVGDHVFDVLASADGHERVAIEGVLTIFQGVTR